MVLLVIGCLCCDVCCSFMYFIGCVLGGVKCFCVLIGLCWVGFFVGCIVVGV